MKKGSMSHCYRKLIRNIDHFNLTRAHTFEDGKKIINFSD